jgi:hypothetical protein
MVTDNFQHLVGDPFNGPNQRKLLYESNLPISGNRDMDTDRDRDGERDEDKDTDGDTKRDRNISAGYQTPGNNF